LASAIARKFHITDVKRLVILERAPELASYLDQRFPLARMVQGDAAALESLLVFYKVKTTAFRRLDLSAILRACTIEGSKLWNIVTVVIQFIICDITLYL
jgi:hypothetical protein